MLVDRSNTEFGESVRLGGPSQGHLLFVVSGAGGREHAGIAAELAAEAVAEEFLDVVPWLSGPEIERSLERSLSGAVQRSRFPLRKLGVTNDRAEEVAIDSSMVAAYIRWPRLYLVGCGATPCFLLRDGDLQNAMDLGPKSFDGSVRLSTLDLQSGDTLLLCDPGLATRVPQADLERLLDATQTADDAARQIVDQGRACDAGEHYVAVVARIVPRGEPIANGSAASAHSFEETPAQ